MPKYCYSCSQCDKIFEIYHSILEDQKKCILCESENTLERIPYIPSILKKENEISSDGKKAGEIVKEFIEETKEDIKQQKEEYKKEEYKT